MDIIGWDSRTERGLLVISDFLEDKVTKMALIGEDGICRIAGWI